MFDREMENSGLFKNFAGHVQTSSGDLFESHGGIQPNTSESLSIQHEIISPLPQNPVTIKTSKVSDSGRHGSGLSHLGDQHRQGNVSSMFNVNSESLIHQVGLPGLAQRIDYDPKSTKPETRQINNRSTRQKMTPNQSKIAWCLSDENALMIISIISCSSLELLQVRTMTRTIGLGSSKISIVRKFQNEEHHLYILLQLDDKSETICLRFRSETGSPYEWDQKISLSKKEIREDGKPIQLKHDEASLNLKMHTTYVHDSSVINILLIGRSQVGKSTLIESLQDPTYSSRKTGISQTREPTYKQLTMTAADGKQYTLNIIDTPGLREIRHNPNETRTDQQLLDLLHKVFDDGRIRALNIIAFVSVMGYTYQNDIDTFKSLIDFFGSKFKTISALILTHCDKLSDGRMKELTEELKKHPKCAEVVNYCELGIHYHGTLDVDDLETYDVNLRERMHDFALNRLKPMRAELINFLLGRSHVHEEITSNDFVHFQQSAARIVS